jgi:hypothetical protein
MIRVSASLRHRSGAEVLRIDTRPVERAAMRPLLDDALGRLCDPDAWTIEEGCCSIVLRVEYAAPPP